MHLSSTFPRGLTLLVLSFAAGFAQANEITNYEALHHFRDQVMRRDADLAQTAWWYSMVTGEPTVELLPSGGMRQIMGVEPGQSPLFFETLSNVVAANSIGVSHLWPGGSSGLNLTGQGVTLGIWDGGNALATHQEFQGRVTVRDNEGSGNHATHVAGTMVAGGIRAAARGMSFQGNLDSRGWNSDTTEMASAAGNGLRASNHSYGLVVGWFTSGSTWRWNGNPALSETLDANFGYYNSTASSWDTVAYNAPFYLPVKAAANDRNQGPNPGSSHQVWSGSAWVSSTTVRERDGGPLGYDCLPPDSTSKNVLVVGAVNDVPGGYQGPSSVTMSSFSSWGPTDDGRIKPDVVGNGVGLESPIASSTTAYATFSGTSMASPNVTGSLGLLIQYRRQLVPGSDLRAATLRGLLIHTADECGSAAGPDYAFGWGLVNARRAAEHLRRDSVWPHAIIEGTLNAGQTYTLRLRWSGSRAGSRVTLVWSDPPRAPFGLALNRRTPVLVNDLDLRVASDDTTFLPWRLDPDNPAAPATRGDNVVDNVEQVTFPAIANDGIVTITVRHKGATLSPGGSQTFSLLVSP